MMWQEPKIHDDWIQMLFKVQRQAKRREIYRMVHKDSMAIEWAIG